jgi:hypothetical protein
VTWFEVATMRDHALLDVRLETGRTIRVHLEAIGLPVMATLFDVADDLGLERQFLHAHRLWFEHPLTGAKVDVSSSCRRISRQRSRRPHDAFHTPVPFDAFVQQHVPLPGDQRLGRWCRGSARSGSDPARRSTTSNHTERAIRW